MVSHAVADDRGVFRLTGLDPGSYLIRTVGRTYEDGGYLPTFYRETQRVDEAATVETLLDEETGNIRVRPIPGRLYTISSSVMWPSTVTLVSDVGRETIQASGPFRFANRPPGQYELFAEATGDRGQPLGGYVPLALDGDVSRSMPLAPRPVVHIDFRTTLGGQLTDTGAIQVLARRVDLAGEAPAESLKLVNGAVTLVQGRWQLMLAPSAAYVAADFRGPRGERPEANRADGWNEITVTNSCYAWYALSDKPGGIHGTVTAGANEPAPGAPVFLEGYDEATHKRVVDLRSTRTDLHGKYGFAGLAPGTYRIVSTFEYAAPEAHDVDTMSPTVFKLDEAQDRQQDLEVFVIR
jgi:hypothetical protein